jgi:hypothetical protein
MDETTMKLYEVILYHNVANAYVKTIEADNIDELRKKAVELWEQDGGEQFIRVDELDFQGDVEVHDYKELNQ